MSPQPTIWNVRRNDDQQVVTKTLVDGAGVAVDLSTAASVRFLALRVFGAPPEKVSARKVFSASAEIDAEATIVSAGDGEVSYTLSAADLDTAGVFHVEWEVTLDDGTKTTYPVGMYDELRVWEDLND